MYSQISVRRWRNAKTNTSGHGVTGIKSFELAPKEMSRKAKIAGVLVKNGDQIVRDNVLIRVCKYLFKRTHLISKSLPLSSATALESPGACVHAVAGD